MLKPGVQFEALRDRAYEIAPQTRILNADRRESMSVRACTSNNGAMCTESPTPCARQRFHISLLALRLHHGRRNGDASPAIGAVNRSVPRIPPVRMDRKPQFPSILRSLNSSTQTADELTTVPDERRCSP